MESSDEDVFNLYNEVIENVQFPRQLRERYELFFKYSDREFEMRFRLSKRSCVYLIGLLNDYLVHFTLRNAPVSPMNQLLLTLRFFATGTFQIVIGDLIGVNKSTVCRIVRRVTHHLALMAKDIIQPKVDQRNISLLQEEFVSIAGFPGIIGAIDCPHIPILSPGGVNAELYRNRKGYFSVNVQAVCTSSLKFVNVVARWPGSVHDGTIFLNSRLRAQLQNRDIPEGSLLGDGGYACGAFLLTPLSSPTNEAEALYNQSHIDTRNPIERAFGVVKRRSPCVTMGLRLKLSTTLKCIVACFVLHNILLERGEDDPPPLEDLHTPARIYPPVDVPLNRHNERGRAATATRTMLLNTTFLERVERRRHH